MKHRRARKITSRISSVTNGFVQAIIPDTLPATQAMEKALKILGIDPDCPVCAYCGAQADQWDHLHPYVVAKRPSGYLNEAGNLVPACGPCNSSKSGRDWRTWMFGDARGSPMKRGVADLKAKAARIETMEQEMGVQARDIAKLIDPELWQRYWSRRDQIEKLMFEAQAEADEIRRFVSEDLAKQGS